MKWSFIMLNKREKPLLRIDEDFLEKVVGIIVSVAIITIEEDALKRYQEIAWRAGRTEEVQKSIAFMKANSDYLARLQEFKKLINNDKSNSGTFNKLLFTEIVNKIPGYESLKDDQLQVFVGKLKDSIIDKITICIRDYEIEQQTQKKRAEEKAAIELTVQQFYNGILIFDDLGEARDAAKLQKDKTIFCLTKKENWTLSILDPEGKAHVLELTAELLANLTQKNIDNLSLLKPEQLNPIKKECNNAKVLFLAQLQLQVNPKKTNAEFKTAEICSTFVLRQAPKNTSLWWINSFGDANKIELKNYPLLSDWLANHPEPLQEEDTLKFKFYLLNVKTSQAINRDKLNLLDGLLAKNFTKETVECIHETAKYTKKTVEETAVTRMKLKINPPEKNDDLENKNCSTFVLRQGPRQTALWWINSLGTINQIKLESYPELKKWLDGCSKHWEEADILQLKQQLLHVNTSRALNTGRVELLDGLLASKLRKDKVQPQDVESVVNKPVIEVEKKPQVEEAVKILPGKLPADKYAGLSQLPLFWHKKQETQRTIENLDKLSNIINAV